MAIGTKITASDYNNLRTKVERILGKGGFNLEAAPDPTFGYGQSLSSVPVLASDQVLESNLNIITRAQWESLRNDIINIKVHQDGTAPAIGSIPENAVVRYGPSHPNTNFDYIISQAAQLSSRSRIAESRSTRIEKSTIDTISPWSSQAQTELTVAFSNADQARYFFNSGGKIIFSSSRSGGSLTPQNSAWTSLLTAVGFRPFDGFSTTTKNFYNLTNQYQNFYTRNSSAEYYVANNFSIEVKANVPNNSSGTATIVYFRITWRDNFVPRPGSPNPDVVDGLLTLRVEELKATGPILPSGNFSITSPTYSLLPINVTYSAPVLTPTYEITSNKTNVDEGSSVNFTVTTTNFGSGTLYWFVETQGNLDVNDFTTMTGTVSISNNSGSFTVTARDDLTTEGAGQFKVGVRSGSASGTIQAYSPLITINDTSITAPSTYTITSNKTNVDEGSSVTFTVTTTNFGSGALYWFVETLGSLNADDFTTQASGTVIISNNSGSFIVTARNDLTTEGAESFRVGVRSGSASGTIQAYSSVVTINDTSTSPAPPSPTYAITSNKTNVDEGSSVTFTVTTTNFGSGALYWFVETSGNIDASDFVTLLNGTVSISNNSGSFIVTARNDLTTEGAESFRVGVRSGSASGTIQAYSSVVTINDTSSTPEPVLDSPLIISPISSNADVSTGTGIKSSSTNFTVTSTHNSTITVSLQEIQKPTGGLISLSPSNFTLAAGASRTISATFSSPSNTNISYFYRIAALASGFTGNYPTHGHTQTKTVPPSGSVEYIGTSSSSTTWTVPSGVTRVKATVIAPGGKGGNSVRDERQSSGGGGGGGGVVIATFQVTPGSSVTVLAPPSSSSLGSLVSTNDVTLISSKGGDGGNATKTTPGTGGTGGIASTSGARIISQQIANGVSGSSGILVKNDVNAGYGKGTAKGGDGGGAGGAGGGGLGSVGDFNGNPGSSYGGGGGGAGVAQIYGSRVNPAYYGGAGGNGYVKLEWGPSI